MTTVERSRYLIPMLERSLRALELLAQAPDGLTLAELSHQLDAPKSSVFNILATLEHHGYIRGHTGGGRVALTTKLYRVGSAAVGRLNLKDSLRPLLVTLVEQSGETANLGILDGGEAVYIASVEGPGRVRVAVAPGERLDLHSTALGKTLLAYQPDEQVNTLLSDRPLLARTPHTITDPAALRRELAAIRAQGFALDDEEDNLDIRCLGAPVRDDSGAVVAAVSLTTPKHRLPDSQLPERAALLQAFAARMSQALGYERS